MSWPDLEPGEREIRITSDSTEECYRNVHPQFIQNGRLTSQVFLLNSGDNGELSTGRSTRVTPRDFFADYARLHKTCGVCSVNAQCIADLRLRWVDDSATTPPPLLKGHAYIDFRDSGESTGITRQKRKIAKMLVKESALVYQK
jgi:hypothetical protein